MRTCWQQASYRTSKTLKERCFTLRVRESPKSMELLGISSGKGIVLLRMPGA